MEPSKMKVYSRDPFAVDPLPKAYYYPSPERQLSRSQKATSINPSRLTESDKEERQYEADRVSPMDEIFLKGTNNYQPKTAHHDSVDDVDFDESWPASERPSSLSLTGLEEESPLDVARFQTIIDRFANLKQPDKLPDKLPDQEKSSSSAHRLRQPGFAKHGATANAKPGKITKTKLPQRVEKKINARGGKAAKSEETDGKPTESVLHRYIERFRNSAPMSREDRERQQHSSSRDFWWLSSGHPANIERPGPSRQVEEEETYQSTPLTEENLQKYSQWEQKSHKHPGLNVFPDSPSDKKTIELQERAEKLLEKSSSTVLSADPAVSTDGLGSNMSDMSTMEEYPYRPAFTAYIDRERVSVRKPEKSRGPGFRPVAQDRQYPEDDPLHQWRLRRKMEQAQERPAKNIQAFDFLAKSEKEKQIDGQLEDFKRKLSGKPGPSCPVQMKSTTGEFTPAPQVPQNVQTSYTMSGTTQSNKPQIASPILHRGRPRLEPEREVDPHLHLMCDLLPCPHQTSYSDHLHQDSQQPSQQDVDRPASSDRRTQYLQAEKPDVDNKLDDKISDRIPVNEAEMVKNDSDGNRVSVSESQNAKTKPEIADSEHKHSKQRAVRIKDSEDGLHPDQQERKSRDRRREGRDSDDEQTERKERSAKSERLPKPRQSSSPKGQRRGVDDAIGQVVKNHLFSMSTSTVLSSVESLPPSASVERLPPPSGGPHLSSLPEHPDRQVEESDESDGEFGDDQLLQMLRRQRSLFEQQLQEIDHLMEELESR